MVYRIALALFVSTFFFVSPAYPESNLEAANEATATDMGKVKPYRTFITLQRYKMENSGKPGSPVSHVRVEVAFPNGVNLPLPEGGDSWPIGNGQVQEINRTYEIPWSYMQRDGFTMKIQMVRKGATINPCEIDVQQLSAFNRVYVCRTDVELQQRQNIPEDRIAREGIELRVFTDLNSTPKEIPQNAIALK